jgi:TctA family transporter
VSVHDAALGIVLPLLVAVPAILICSATYGYIPTWLSVLMIVIAHVGTAGFRKATPRP